MLESDEPTIEFVILAEHAEVIHGKLYLMRGGWETITMAAKVLDIWSDAKEHGEKRRTCLPNQQNTPWMMRHGLSR